jgi:crossover junction endodeoxyribonuclease RuvC
MQGAPGPLTSSAIRILGVDPAAIGPTGYGIIETDGRRCRTLGYGALRIPSERQEQSPGAALSKVYALLCRLIEEFSPHSLAVEAVFAARNVKTALRLAEVRGVVLLAAAQHEVAVYSYSPREVKATIAGYGHADKRQVQVMVRALLSMSETPEPADAADALAVALCHVQIEGTRQKFDLPPPALLTRSLARPERLPRAAGPGAREDHATPGARSRISTNRRSRLP